MNIQVWFGECSTKKQQDWQTPLHEEICRALCQCHWRLFPWRIRRHGLNYPAPHLGADANLSLPLPAKHRRDVGQPAGFHIYSISLTNGITRNIYFFFEYSTVVTQVPSATLSSVATVFFTQIVLPHSSSAFGAWLAKYPSVLSGNVLFWMLGSYINEMTVDQLVVHFANGHSIPTGVQKPHCPWGPS